MSARLSRFLRSISSAVCCVLIVGCASTGGRAPVEDRSTGARPAATPAAAGTPAGVALPPSAAATAPKPNAENAGKPGFHTVRPGETLARIALDNGQNWRDVARWNNIENPNVIEVGQVLRVIAPGNEAVAMTQPVASGTRIESKPLDTRASAMETASTPASTQTTSSAASAAAPAPAAPVAREGDEDVNWLWPAAGPLLASFDEARNVKGMAIGGKLGDPVNAAADGRVVYAGSGLRGYGNLVIVKHNNTFLTAYAHNQTLLVREDQVVRRGQKIAEMGSSDADRVQLHFEIRRLGKPVDPARLLPPR
jgi:lipoprotein NlpD